MTCPETLWTKPHLWPGSGPPLGRAGAGVTGSAGLGTLLAAVFGVNGSVGAVLERLHALDHTRLMSQLPAGFTARSPLLHHPPAHKHTPRLAFIQVSGRHMTCQMFMLRFIANAFIAVYSIITILKFSCKKVLS